LDPQSLFAPADPKSAGIKVYIGGNLTVSQTDQARIGRASIAILALG
jgi:hypothetical protein